MKILILAAGKGTRLHSDKFNLPKALKEFNGKPMIRHILDNASFIDKKDIYIVIGYKGEMIREYLKDDYNYIIQKEQLGTGHAVSMAESYLKDCNDDIMILYGDMPLISSDTIKSFISSHKNSKAKCSIMTAIFENQPPYGRIIRDDNGKFVDVIEEKDCTKEQLKIHELNCGPYIVHSSELFKYLHKIRNNNTQGEYYLTDIPGIMTRDGKDVNVFICGNSYEMLGINTLDDLKDAQSMI